MSTVSFKNISKIFDDGTLAVTAFDLDIADGELMVLVGPSGCGKTTLLRMLAGLETVSSGELLIDGRVVNPLPPQQRDIAMVFQNYALYPHMTVRRNLEFPLRMMKLGKDERRQRVSEVAGLLGLTALLERKPRELSGGQRQRVAMGRAIVREPKVFLMDEPLSNLDARLRLQIRGEIAALQRRMRTTTLYVTHDQVEAMTLGDRVAVIDQGRLQQVDEPQNLYAHPANIFVARFIGSPGMNIFRTELHPTEDRGLAIDWGRQRLPLDAGQAHALRKYLGKTLYAGLRPEAIHYPDAPDVEATIVVKIESIEALGHESLLYFGYEGRMEETRGDLSPDNNMVSPLMVARLAGTPDAGAGESLRLGLALKQLYFFDAEGSAIC